LEKYSYDICVVGGLGHVGLPLGIAFAKAEKKVILYDINHERANLVLQGKMPFMESHADKALKDVLSKKLFITSEKTVISESQFVVLTIGTPINEHLNPRFTLFKEFFSEITALLGDDQHVIIRSTVFPGTTEKIAEFLKSKWRSCGVCHKLSLLPLKKRFRKQVNCFHV
jgi:UDP-N-acetyl-D-mannosaminuronic acid dehydrogenase